MDGNDMESKTTVLNVQGMGCQSCVSAVEDALNAVEGVRSVSVDLEAESATVTGTASDEQLVAAATEAGYEASV